MKMLFFACLAFLSLEAFTQSYMVMDNGIILTTDNAGYIYDLGYFTYPDKVTLKGGNYFSESNNILVTIDDKGTLYRKYEVVPTEFQGKGMNYFLAKTGELFTVDKNGVVAIKTDGNFGAIKSFGGNYFILQGEPLQIVTISDAGVVLTTTVDNLRSADVVSIGGSYFMTNRGIIYTVSAEGVLNSDIATRVGIIDKRGGTYFTDSSRSIFTVATDGQVKVPSIPVSLNVQNITKTGSNYFLDKNGKLFIVDKDGQVFERSLTDHDFKNASIISL